MKSEENSERFPLHKVYDFHIIHQRDTVEYPRSCRALITVKHFII